MTYKNSFSGWKTTSRSNLPWNLGEFRSILENAGAFVPQASRVDLTRQADDPVLSCRDADSPCDKKHSRSFFVILLKTRNSPFFPPTLINWSLQRRVCSLFRPLHQEQTLPINSCVGGLRCFKSRKPEDRLGCHKLWKIACVASIGHWAERSAQERSPFLPNTKPKLISIEMVGFFLYNPFWSKIEISMPILTKSLTSLARKKEKKFYLILNV